MVGAGVGGAAVIGLLYAVFPLSALQIVSLAGGAGAVLGARELRAGGRATTAAALTTGLLALAFLGLPPTLFQLDVSRYKALSQQLNVSGAFVATERSSPLGRLTVVRSPTVPLRHAPGLGITATVGIPEQIGVFTDGDGPAVINRDDGTAHLAYLDQLTSALPYHLREIEHVLVLGAGGGSLVHQALQHDAAATAVELNGQLTRLVEDDYRAFSGALYSRADVQLVNAEARGFVARAGRRYDLVQVALMEAFGASAGGLYALNEEYLYTVDALRGYYGRLEDDGYLALTRWVKLPLRDSLKLFATAVAALEAEGVAVPSRHLLMIRSWQTATLVMGRTPFDAAQIERARQFCRARAFDLVWYHDMAPAEANRFNHLADAAMYEGARALAGPEAESFLQRYKFNLRPATDDRPYFGNFFKWSTLPEILSLRGQGGVPLLESGYLILVVTLVQALLVSLLLVLLPLWRRLRAAPVRRLATGTYFAALGLAFLFVEIAFIQKFMLFLHHPVLAVAVVLTAFLVFAGLGSLIAARVPARMAGRLVTGAVLAIGLTVTLYLVVLPTAVFTPLVGAPAGVRAAVAVALVALLALPMGMPFPAGMARLGREAPALIPVAWAVNGCASVAAAVLATLLAIHFGFSAVLIAAVALYVLAAGSFRF
jgi:spermidine synthase